MGLVLDIKIKIAKLDEDVWYYFYRYDDEFYKYSKSTIGINLFKLTFTKVSYTAYRTEYYLLNKYHRDGDLPAIISKKGSQYWYKAGRLHRDGGLPAYITSTGEKIWYKKGKRHRDDDLPAYINEYGLQFWYKKGKLHRDNELPAVIWADGVTSWYKDGKYIKGSKKLII